MRQKDEITFIKIGNKVVLSTCRFQISGKWRVCTTCERTVEKVR